MRTDEEIRRLVGAFEDCTLPKADWTHREHLTVAAWYLRHHEYAEAVQLMRRCIERFNAAKGSAMGYHETITLAWMTIIAAFIKARSSAESIAELVRELVAQCGQRDYLLKHYSRDRLFSDAARHGWLPPDLTPLEG
jgi:hypothetical protein